MARQGVPWRQWAPPTEALGRRPPGRPATRPRRRPDDLDGDHDDGGGGGGDGTGNGGDDGDALSMWGPQIPKLHLNLCSPP